MGLATSSPLAFGSKDQAEVDGEAPVVFGDLAQRLAREHRLDDGAHPRLAEPFDQAIEVRVLPPDEDLCRLVHVRRADGLRPVSHEHLGELPRQSVDEPRLALGQREGPVYRFGDEGLARLRGVLAVERGDLVPGEVAQGDRVRLDVERARRAQPVSSAGGHLVVSDVPEPDQRQGVGKALRPVGVTVADLAEDGHQRLVAQRIDLVEKDDQRPRCRAGPRGQCGGDPVAGSRVGPRWR